MAGLQAQADVGELTGCCCRMLGSSFEADLRVTGVDDGAQALARRRISARVIAPMGRTSAFRSEKVTRTAKLLPLTLA